MRIALWVALGSGFGGTTRVLLAAWMLSLFGSNFPIGVLAVNVIGSFVIGLAATLMAADGRFFAGPTARQFIMAGFCGGFTTFSFFSLQTMQLLESGRPATAFLYSFLTLALGMFSVWTGHVAGASWNRWGATRKAAAQTSARL